MSEDTPAALQATYSDLKIIKTRGSFQLIFEMPLEGFNHAMAVLGGAPRPDQEVWVGIARLHESLERIAPAPDQKQIEAGQSGQSQRSLPPPDTAPKRTWFDLAPTQRASMRCEDHRFRAWLKQIGRIEDATEELTVDYVRRIAGGSRSNLGKSGFDKETVSWETVDRAFAAHLEKQLIDRMR